MPTKWIVDQFHFADWLLYWSNLCWEYLSNLSSHLLSSKKRVWIEPYRSPVFVLSNQPAKQPDNRTGVKWVEIREFDTWMDKQTWSNWRSIQFDELLLLFAQTLNTSSTTFIRCTLDTAVMLMGTITVLWEMVHFINEIRQFFSF